MCAYVGMYMCAYVGICIYVHILMCVNFTIECVVRMWAIIVSFFIFYYTPMTTTCYSPTALNGSSPQSPFWG